MVLRLARATAEAKRGACEGATVPISHRKCKPSNEESISSPAVEVAAAQDKEQHDNVFNDPENESSPKPLRDPSTARPEGSSLWHKPRDPTASVSAAATVGSKTSKRPRLSE